MSNRLFLALNAVFVLAMAGLAVLAAWPIYQTPALLLAAGGAVLLAGLISWLGLVRKWSWLTVLLVTVAAYLVFGLPLAMPGTLASIPEGGLGALGSGLLALLTAPVLAWKQLVTLALPVGSYQTMLVPAFIVLLGGTTAALSAAWRAPRAYVLAVPFGWLMQAFGLLFGSSAVSATIVIAGMSLRAPRESLLGLGALLVAVAFLVWRAREARSRAIRVASAVSGIRRRRALGGTLRQAGLGALVLVLALAVAVPVAVTAIRPASRDVLRTAIDPAVSLHERLSPLSEYRSFVAGPLQEETLFEVKADDDISRLRLAVLSFYDGEVFRVTDPRQGVENQETAFARMPSFGASGEAEAEVTVGDYDAVWLPTAGEVSSIRFTGPRRQSLSDGFFYNSAAGAGVQLRGLSSGDRYTVSVRPSDEVELAELDKPRRAEGLLSDKELPSSLVEWVRSQRVGSDAAGLQTLVERLRARGYLSHALTQPSGADAAWLATLDDYSFEPSLAGHSVDRIGAMFTALLEKQSSTSSTDDADLVAAVGDDEQFAVATALIAQHLGFPSRVVLGFELGEGAAACPSGVCTGAELQAWAEVGDGNGAWATVVATPQYENPLAPRDDERRDPRNDTEVLQREADELLPPEASPTGGEKGDSVDEEEGADLGWLWASLRITGMSLLVLLVPLAPLLLIGAAKAARRRERRRASAVTARIAGGWDEFVDTAVDYGFAAPSGHTRGEYAATFGARSGDGGPARLAVVADAAVFGDTAVNDAAATEFWALVEAERRAFAAGLPRVERWRARLSLRSFARFWGRGSAPETGKVK